MIRELGNQDAQLLSELVGIMQDEHRKKDAEAEILVNDLEDKGEWSSKPSMSDYCGLEEGRHRYLMCESKNSNGNCDDFEPWKECFRKCSTCRHQQNASGPSKDELKMKEYEKLILNEAVLPGGGGAMDDLKKAIQSISQKKTFEIQQAYYVNKFSFWRPEYLSICRLHSTPTDFFPCAIKNPHDHCPSWQNKSMLNKNPDRFGTNAGEPVSWQTWKTV